jgi:hypothetical protein
MDVEQWVERELTVEIEVVGGNLPQWHYVHHKSYLVAAVGSRRLTT